MVVEIWETLHRREVTLVREFRPSEINVVISLHAAVLAFPAFAKQNSLSSLLGVRFFGRQRVQVRRNFSKQSKKEGFLH